MLKRKHYVLCSVNSDCGDQSNRPRFYNFCIRQFMELSRLILAPLFSLSMYCSVPRQDGIPIEVAVEREREKERLSPKKR